ncbi:hypothetical protein QVZ41_13875 [Wenyingzhuangia sp. chi5]|uniref:Uncharacterized protein n=1 Tax=Wenyingzhuangia gilva TaxID=3057677 RepID=A0ABT8VVI4_9FLAO|nr:hypothetical protein [Wenyingzhuangia sp. chi5]MDO3695935.1 hypothetical protein [Wenyingzhuangia sp. chi5]
MKPQKTNPNKKLRLSCVFENLADFQSRTKPSQNRCTQAKMKKIEHLFIGILFLLIAFYFFGSQIFTSENSLIENKGKVNNSKVFYEKVKDKYGAESVRATLIISLLNDNKVYIMRENIGQCSEFKSTQQTEYNEINYNRKSILEYPKNTSNCYSLTYETINRKINKTKEISIFINRNELKEKEPYVYKIISTDNKVLYSLNQSKRIPLYGFWIISIFSIFEILMFLRINYGIKLKKIIIKKLN